MTRYAARRRVLSAGDVVGSGLKLKKTYSAPGVLAALKPGGCHDECTSEFDDRQGVVVRSSAEIYGDAGAASKSLRDFASLVGQQAARDSAAPSIGEESALFVTAILTDRRRFMSYALCWRQDEVIGKVTLVGPAERVNKAMVERLARSQAGKVDH